MPESLAPARTRRLRENARALGLVCLLSLLGGCSAPERVPIEKTQAVGDIVPAATFSAATPGAALPIGWQPWIILPSKRRTAYALVRDANQVVLHAKAQKAASGVYRTVNVDTHKYPFLRWRWRVDASMPDADPRKSSAEDAPARILIAFAGDNATLDPMEQVNLTLASALSGQTIPYATLIYVWSDKVPVDTVVRNSRTSRVKMIVVDSGAAGLSEWVTLERNVADDFRRAFDEEPGAIERIGVMTDSDNTAGTAEALYGDMQFRPEPSAR